MIIQVGTWLLVCQEGVGKRLQGRVEYEKESVVVQVEYCDKDEGGREEV